MTDRIGSLVAALFLAGCAEDPRLAVIVEHDPAYVDLVATTTIVVYEGENITCQAIEFGDVTGAQLDLLEVSRTEITGATKTGDFENTFSRAGHKAVVARGIDAAGKVVLVECEDVDEVVGARSITIATAPAATVSIVGAEDGKRGVLVLATDPRSVPIANRPVSWRLHGAAGTSADPLKFTNVDDGVWEPKAPTCTTSDGEAIIHPAPPKVPGAFAVQARVSWAAEAPVLFTQFTALDTPPIGDLDRSLDKPCALRRTSGATTLVCLETPTRAREFALTGKVLAPAGTHPFPQAVVALVSLENGPDLDVYGLTGGGAWFAAFDAPTADGTAAWDCGAGVCQTFDLQIAPACDDSPALLIGRVGLLDATATIQTMPVKGGTPRNFKNAMADGISNAGCITELQVDGTTQTRQVVVVETGDVVPALAVFECAANTAGCAIPLLNGGVGFIAGAENRMVVSSFDATGTVLSTVVVRPSDKANPTTGEDRFIERTRQSAAAPPVQLVAGRFDTGDDLDLIWHFPLTRSSNVQLAYAQEVDGAPITAILPIGGSVVDVFAANLNGDSDGFDDLVFVIDRTERVGNQQVTTRRLQAITPGIEYDNFQVVDDPKCQ